MRLTAGRVLVTCLAWLCASGALIAQDELPTAQQVLERSIEASGGQEKFRRVTTLLMKGTLAVPEANAKGSVEVYYASPARVCINVNIDGSGVTTRAINGKVAWEISPNSGERLLTDEERLQLLQSISMQSVFDPLSVYQSIQNEGIEEVDGQPCFKLRLRRKGVPEPEITFYSKKTGLAVKSLTTRNSPFGKVNVESILADYKEFNGLKMATKVTHKMTDIGLTQEIAFDAVEYNQEIKESVFRIPPEIAQLAK